DVRHHVANAARRAAREGVERAQEQEREVPAARAELENRHGPGAVTSEREDDARVRRRERDVARDVMRDDGAAPRVDAGARVEAALRSPEWRCRQAPEDRRAAAGHYRVIRQATPVARPPGRASTTSRARRSW